jgi:cytoskeletal protein RodZ
MPRQKVSKAKVEKEEAEAKINEIKRAAERTIYRRNRKIRNYKIILGLVALILIAAAVAGALVYRDLKKENDNLRDPQASAQAEIDRIKSEVAALYDVPPNESPTIATVSDVNKLQNQAFFANAQNGDKVLIYNQAKKAILYRPSSNKIVEVAPINIGNATSPDSTEAQDKSR